MRASGGGGGGGNGGGGAGEDNGGGGGGEDNGGGGAGAGNGGGGGGADEGNDGGGAGEADGNDGATDDAEQQRPRIPRTLDDLFGQADNYHEAHRRTREELLDAVQQSNEMIEVQGRHITDLMRKVTRIQKAIFRAHMDEQNTSSFALTEELEIIEKGVATDAQMVDFAQSGPVAVQTVAGASVTDTHC